MDCQPGEQLIQGPVGELECLINCPDTPATPDTFAIVCHPHPLYGGALTNKVVYMITSTFNSLGIGVVRFNFRGVGKSQGTFDNGIGETADLQAVTRWAQQYFSFNHLWLAGFSFGSYIAFRAHASLAAERLLLVAPPVERFAFADNQLQAIPTLIIQGGQDEVISPQAVVNWVQAQQSAPQLQWLAEADHFFHGQLNLLREVIKTAWG